MKKRSGEAFLNGDRSVLQSITEAHNEMLCKTQERLPSPPPKEKPLLCKGFLIYRYLSMRFFRLYMRTKVC